ncbi:MAG: protein kinase [Candidatus Cloacimonetes bacterium]|nr:protein kinase [Candidatus Cloacimonadota bacterium]
MIIDSRYKVLKNLGAGMWATVYKVKDLRTNKTYALKLFQMLDAESLYEKFTAEDMHHITKLQHPNLIHVSDFGNFGKHIYCLSEYFEGKTLSNFRFKKSSIDLLYDIIIQVCYALNALHSQNIIHKDLKPDNVIYRIKDNKIHLKVMDYGFTKIDMARSNQRVGSVLPYIAPEVYLGKKAVIQSDFYSMGAILYKITTGSLPYTIEQISRIMAGDKYNIFPKFPKELNPDIPDGLEKLILKLLERNPEDRFKNIETIISYINTIQLKKYLFSRRWSIVNNIQFSDYIVRENYSHQLLDYIPIISRGNGKIISLSAGKGLGKNNVLTLFRYHLLTDEYYIFDYECGHKNKDPFFALIKEFYCAVENNKQLASDLSNISQKLSGYLFKSEENVAQKVQNEKELDIDFQSASNFIFHLSENKPLIYIIRAAEYLGKEVFDFVNFISKNITNRKVLIILSLNDPRKLKGLIHPAQIKIEALNFFQAKKYIERLLMETPPDDFIDKIWKRSNGNPLFIEQILIDLTQKKEIWKYNKFNFDYNLNDYELPDEIVQAIYLRMTHLSKINYRYFKKLSAVHTPLSNKLIKYILDIDDKELFLLLEDSLNNELMMKKNNFYFITFKEARNRFLNETSEKTKKIVSSKVLKFFENKAVTEDLVIIGFIKHAEYINDYVSMRKYNLLLAKLYSEKQMYDKSFNEICKVIELDFSKKIKLSENDLKNDLMLLLDKSRWVRSDEIPEKIKYYIRKMPDDANKQMIMGTFYLELEKYQFAQKRLERALRISIIEKQKIFIILKLCKVYLFRNNYEKLNSCLKKLENYKLSDVQEIEYIGFKALAFSFTTGIDEGINLIEEYLPTVKTKNNVNYFIRLGTLHNDLAVLYHKKKLLDEADKNFEIARKIWENIHFKRKLGAVYNNIGDVALIKGDTEKAFEYFRKALQICSQVDCKRIKVLSLLNHGQAYIKQGHFNIAEKYLKDALNTCLVLETKPFHSSIINNLAIAKSKINNFGYYINFIQKNVPDIIKGNIYKITPLTKTYFYYLYEIGDYNKIEILLKKTENLFIEHKEHEFYYQMLGFLFLHKKDYPNAITNIELAFKYSKQNKSNYAQTINYIRLIECYLALGDIKKSYELCRKAELLCEKNFFRYWETVLDLNKIKIQLLDENINLRELLRKLQRIELYVNDNHLFILEIEVYSLMLQIYAELNIKSKAESLFEQYKKKIEKAVVGLPDLDREMYLEKRKFYLTNYTGLKTVKIVPHIIHDTDRWHEELFDILKLKEISRMKYFINRTIRNLLSPYYYAIALKDEIDKCAKPFLKFNIDIDVLYSEKFLENIKSCFEESRIIQKKISNNHILFVPLKIKTAEVGCMIIADKGELPFLASEKEVIKNLRLYLTSILLRINEFEALNNDMELMTKLVETTQNFFSILNIDKLEQEVIAFVLDFIGGSRGFLIKKDKYENYIYKVALDDSKHILKSYAYISKAVLSEVQKLKNPINIVNAKENKIFDSYIDFRSESHSIYCAPILIDGVIYGFLYIDNYNSSENKMKINPEFMRLLLIQISVAFKNAMQYEILMHKNQEISSLDDLKKDFINIISHELKTPLVSMQGYMNRLKKVKFPQKEYFVKAEESADKLNSIIKDLINFNKYQMMGEIEKTPVSVNSILNAIKDETEIISKDRHMQIKLEIDSKMKRAKLNWEAFYLMIYNIVLNSIRFTKDFGTILIGARSSTFQQEEIEGKESLVVYIQDNGIGIPEGELKKVFQKFYELSDIISHSSGMTEFKSSGLGLGLSTAELIAKLHNGKIWINSEENEGTTVFVAIPF